MAITRELVHQAESGAGFARSGDIGGLHRNVYYTPDGRKIRAIPSMREYVVKDKIGNVISNGTRDANLDKGWLLTPPQRKKPYCPTCDGWHENQAQIDACKDKQAKFIASMEKKGRKERAEEHLDEIQQLKKQVADLQKIVQKLAKV